MTRIAVIGNAGGGKTTMCAKLGRALNIGVYPIDKIQWKSGSEFKTGGTYSFAA